MKFIIFILLSSVGLASVSTEVSYVSKYIFRGDLIYGQSLQASVNLAGENFYANIWASETMREHGGETDFSVGFSKAGFDAGVVAYTYRETDSDDWITWEPCIGYGHDIGPLKASVYAYYDINLKTKTAEAKLTYEYAFGSSLKASVDLSAGTSGGTDLRRYWYWSIGPTIKYSFSEKASVFAGAMFHDVSMAMHGGSKTAFKIGASYEF